MSQARREVRLSGGPVSYLEWLPPGSPAQTLVLLHGAGLDCAQLAWGHLGAGLASAGYRVRAPDLPGFGESPGATWPATQSNLLACVAGFLDELRLDEVTLGGVSMGGAVSLGYALREPERVPGLVLAASAGFADRVVENVASLPFQILTRLMARAGKLDVGARWKALDRPA